VTLSFLGGGFRACLRFLLSVGMLQCAMDARAFLMASGHSRELLVCYAKGIVVFCLANAGLYHDNSAGSHFQRLPHERRRDQRTISSCWRCRLCTGRTLLGKPSCAQPPGNQRSLQHDEVRDRPDNLAVMTTRSAKFFGVRHHHGPRTGQPRCFGSTWSDSTQFRPNKIEKNPAAPPSQPR
jgi:hypothetical protein